MKKKWYLLVIMSLSFFILFSCKGNKRKSVFTIEIKLIINEEEFIDTHRVKYRESFQYIFPENEYDSELSFFEGWNYNGLMFTPGESMTINKIEEDLNLVIRAEIKEGVIFEKYVLILEEDPNTTYKYSIKSYRPSEEDTTLIIPNNGPDNYPIREILPRAFQNATTIETLKLPNSLIIIGAYAFSGAINLKEVEFPMFLTTIDQYAFYDCESLEEVILPNQVKMVGKSAFENNLSLQRIVFSPLMSSISDRLFYNAISLTNVVLPHNITVIGHSAFSHNKSLTTINLNEITEIGNYAFNGCDNLTYVNLSNNLRTIKMGVFSNCTNLKNIVIPKNIAFIDDYAFQNSGIVHIVIPKTVRRVGKKAFDGCIGLEMISIELNEGQNSHPDTWEEDWLGDCCPTIIYA